MIILFHFANLAKKSVIFTALVSSKASEHPKSRASSADSLPALQPAVPTQRRQQPSDFGAFRVPWAPANTQAGDDNVFLLPSCGRATTSQLLSYFTKNPSILIWRLFALGSSPELFSLLKCSCIYQDNWCFYVKGARIHFQIINFNPKSLRYPRINI